MTDTVYAPKQAPRIPRGPAGGIYPKRVKGRWRTLKTTLLVAVAGMFYLLPLLRWQREAGRPDQALLFDFNSARAYVFGFEFGPQDLFLLLAVLIAAAFTLFLTNTIIGRVWCGFSCPQTLWTDLFMMIERWFEGDRNERIRRETHPKAGYRFRTAGKHATWLAISVVTGVTVVSYFVDARTLWPAFLAGSASAAESAFILVFTATTYLLAGFAREVVCTHMCPWPRFQSAMLDIDTRVISYRSARGEPRGPLKRSSAEAVPTGDCVDCGLCVAVCPTGIDIRNGMQLACIGCGLCADACDDVMKKLNRPLGLIAFVSEREISSTSAATGSQSSHRFRVRPAAFATLLIICLGVIAWSLLGRTSIDLAVNHERAPPFVTLSDGSIRNIFTVRVADRRVDRTRLRVDIDGLDGAAVQVSRSTGHGAPADELVFDGTSGESTFRLTVTVAASMAPAGRREIAFRVAEVENGTVVARQASYFWGPTGGKNPP